MDAFLLEGLIEARHAYAESYVKLYEQLDRTRLLPRRIQRKMQKKAEKILQHLIVIDKWLEGIENDDNNS